MPPTHVAHHTEVQASLKGISTCVKNAPYLPDTRASSSKAGQSTGIGNAMRSLMLVGYRPSSCSNPLFLHFLCTQALGRHRHKMTLYFRHCHARGLRLQHPGPELREESTPGFHPPAASCVARKLSTHRERGCRACYLSAQHLPQQDLIFDWAS